MSAYSHRIYSVLYLLDANVLIDANRDYYPIDRVPEFWDWLIVMGESGQIKVPQEIYEEIVAGKQTGTVKDTFREWLEKNKNALLLNEDVREELVTRVTEEGYANDLSDDEIGKMGRDPFLIAYALADLGQRCVVSNEASKPRRSRANRHVPDVCRDFRVPCHNTFALIRALDFNTGWGAR